MVYLLSFLLAFVLVFFYYYVAYIRKHKKFNEKKLPSEIILLVKWYKLDVKKIGYKKLLWHIALTNSLGVGLVLLATNLVEHYLLKLSLALGLVLIYVIISNYLLGKIYQKKGWTQK